MCSITRRLSELWRTSAAINLDFDAKMQQNEDMETAAKFFLDLTGAKSIRAIASQAGLDASTTNRQLNGTNTLAVETVVAICRAYRLDFVEAFVAVGFLTEEEAKSLGGKQSLANFTDLELANEIVRRVENGEAGTELTDPIATEPDSNVIVGGFGKTVEAIEIPENVEEEWAGQIAADPAGDDPIDHGTP